MYAQDLLAFNRTSVELKLDFTPSMENGTPAFNRTSVELKHAAGFHNRIDEIGF